MRVCSAGSISRFRSARWLPLIPRKGDRPLPQIGVSVDTNTAVPREPIGDCAQAGGHYTLGSRGRRHPGGNGCKALGTGRSAMIESIGWTDPSVRATRLQEIRMQGMSSSHLIGASARFRGALEDVNVV